MSIALFQVGSLCLIGEWLNSKSDDLLNATYDCKWYEQSKTFKKDLVTIRTVCIRETRIGVVKFGFSNESFYNVIIDHKFADHSRMFNFPLFLSRLSQTAFTTTTTWVRQLQISEVKFCILYTLVNSMFSIYSFMFQITNHLDWVLYDCWLFKLWV